MPRPETLPPRKISTPRQNCAPPAEKELTEADASLFSSCPTILTRTALMRALIQSTDVADIKMLGRT